MRFRHSQSLHLNLFCDLNSLGVADQIPDGLAVEVGESDGLGQSILLEFLHGRPRLRDGDVDQMHLRLCRARVEEPLRRVTSLERNKLNSFSHRQGEKRHEVNVEKSIDIYLSELKTDL